MIVLPTARVPNTDQPYYIKIDVKLTEICLRIVTSKGCVFYNNNRETFIA